MVTVLMGTADVLLALQAGIVKRVSIVLL